MSKIITRFSSIETAKADLLVHEIDSRLDPTVCNSNIVLQAGGHDLINDVLESRMELGDVLEVGDSILTSGYDLNCEHVLHVVPPYEGWSPVISDVNEALLNLYMDIFFMVSGS